MVLPTPQGLARAEELMSRALDIARRTPPEDVPVGALLLAPDGRELARATNRREADGDPTAHAEVLAIRAAAARRLDGWRLTDCTLVVTLEPCAMCAGALVGARVGELIFGAFEPKTGAVGSVFDVVRDPGVMHAVQVRGGVLERECSALMSDFFRRRRPSAGTLGATAS